ncbi:S8 family peptidase [Mycoplasmopsis alligatoris]|uniref:Peptidase S8/S53 domain-containing protein n=1 Tax=Mycoplasmopsis alligatoris A21JP2 TaxID=747682 RepID=D4XWI5_9BACT|nr:S8 family peptidase [Mycoplasmopsis alligatoris]EFF41208.1 conserved hypothetical protein [Mycoplasmopsis alligatoris A21JP2]
MIKWKKVFKGVLLSVEHNKIIPKSSRINTIFSGKNSNQKIVGIKYNESKSKHIITYYLDIKYIIETINSLKDVSNILKKFFPSGINSIKFKELKSLNIIFSKSLKNLSRFKGILVDISCIESFKIILYDKKPDNNILTFFKTEVDLNTLLKEIGIVTYNGSILDQTVFLKPNELEKVFKEIPYLVSMSTKDTNEFFYNNTTLTLAPVIKIPDPENEPIIGVIDTLFDTSVYFNKWVEYVDCVDLNLPRNQSDYEHGTGVSSLIVDGETLNPWLADGCGRFRVKHFGVLTGSKFSSFAIVKNIKEIVATNKEIKVWNLSLGSNNEINDNFISFEGAALDKIQEEYDVIFIISGTNAYKNNDKKIRSPADSINSVVVNSVNENKDSSDYSRRGIVLSFFLNQMFHIMEDQIKNRLAFVLEMDKN